MDFAIPAATSGSLKRFREFLDLQLQPHLSVWYAKGDIPQRFFRDLGGGGWYGMQWKNRRLSRRSVLREALLTEEMAKLSPGVAVAALAHVDLGLTGLFLFGSDALKERYGPSAVRGDTLMCLGNTESRAGSDVAAISMRAEKTDGGWLLNGTKAYVTNGLISDLAVITAVSDPQAGRNQRLSMFLVELNREGVHRTKLNKQVWIPSDLTRLQFQDVFVPQDHLLGQRGRGLQQVLTVFTHSRVPISALTLGTAVGAFELALDHANKRAIFGQKIANFQAKAFEIADFYAKIEAARLMLWKSCWLADTGADFRQASSLAKYLAVDVARAVTLWAADLFGAVSVIREHPIHKFPMDAWASSLGEGTQDVQKLVIFRELMKRYA
ncbi:MAG: acyl-CoA dehydrogenase family protein [Desulfobacterales bacterium]|nr:MAG: acyl-CoA dehydrogenase family protein [Desulfobacterales bacterium]